VPIKPNYSFEKRQRELAKKRKKEEKAARKSTGPGDPVPAGGTPEPTPPAPDKA
jgi:parvulin-like peptidyl-prolyl isomerase